MNASSNFWGILYSVEIRKISLISELQIYIEKYSESNLVLKEII